MTIFKPKSSHIREVGYDDASRSMAVKFHNGKVYTHLGVPPEAFVNMQKYRSAGEFYHRIIKRYKLAV